MDEQTRIAAVQKILDDRDAVILERIDVRKEIKALAARDRLLEMKLRDLKAAGRVFDQGVATPTDPAAFESLEAAQKAMFTLRGDKVWVPGKSHAIGDDLEDDSDPVEDETANPDTLRIRDHVLNYLKGASQKGGQAADIRAHLQNNLNIKTHEKTVGMTLYRLSRENLVKREGRTWFFVSDEETKNPGGSAPGSIEARSSGKEAGT